MKENQKRHTTRIRNLVISLVLTALILSVSTYAWFIGMRTVSVDEFSVEIASTKELELSLNGQTWADTVTINQTNFSDVSYEENTNWWTGSPEPRYDEEGDLITPAEGEHRGLIPMSSIGTIDQTASRLVLYEKSSLTTSAGGYRIMASRAENEGDTEAPGYVAFDLFIKNHTGADYIEELDKLNEESIYLSVDSGVSVASHGVLNTGIENSVRVAFAQIGRVEGTTETVTDITGITCDDVEGKVTGICERPAVIWEPNDTQHVSGAIGWYNTACKARTSTTEFSGPCSPIEDGTYYPTYAIGAPIGSEKAVDVYDGPAYNGFGVNVTPRDGEFNENGLLYEYPTFTDTMKVMEGMQRPEFMSLAPNSITKVRIYIFIEGQDIDNYDFAAIGKAISVKFGFTKQRFEPSDFDYSGPLPTTTTTQP
ncbi:MAG: hypothetical protein PHF21_01515 [Bacilli bacterium]|nr:hypothetical protein [Bacilli bacterium]